jgi:hypothetical protein
MPESAGSVNIVLSVNKANFSAAMADAQRQLDAFAGKAKSAGHGTVSSMQAASASIRLLENPLGNNIRAIERLVSQSKLLSGVMKAAFPVVGAIAAVTAVAKLGEEVAKFIAKVNATPAALKAGFGSMHDAAQLSNDELRRTNDALANEIAKLEHKPQNNLAIALDDARINADKLGISLTEDAKKVKELLEQNKIGSLESMLMGKDSTVDVAGSVNSYLQQIADLGHKINDAVHKGDTAGADSLRQQLSAKQASYREYLDNEIKTRTGNVQIADGTTGAYSLVHGDQSSNLNILYGARDVEYDRQDEQSEQAQNVALNDRKVKDENAKALLDQQKQAAQKLKEAQKQAAEEQLRQFEDSNSAWKAEGERSLADDAKWWSDKLNTLTVGSANWIANSSKIYKKITEDAAQAQREYHAAIEKFTTEYESEGDKRDWLPKDTTDYVDQQGKAAAEWIKNLREGATAQTQTGDAIAEAALKMQVATGQMSKLDAAQVLATMHTQQYTAQMQALADARKSNEDNSSLTDLQRKAQLAGVDNQIAGLNGQRQLQVMEARQATNPASSSASAGFTDALNDFVNSTRDAAAQMKQITETTLATVNTQLVRAMSGQKTDWRGAGAGIFRNVAATGLQKAEGSALSALGFGGKPDGSQSKPLYVRLVQDASSAASSAGSWLSKLFGGGGGASSAAGAAAGGDGDGGSSLTGSLGSVFMTALPMLASGGPLSANTMAIVGEKGPELFMPSTSGTVIPNHQLTSFGGGGGDTHNYAIDARGATDPAQTTAQITRALRVAAPQIVSASTRSVQERSKRRPATSK